MRDTLKREIRRWHDPFKAWRNSTHWRKQLAHLADGEYTLSFDVPYIPQFASPNRINDYIHNGYTGHDDPQRHTHFGAEDDADYVFWSARVCALACLKMAIMAYDTAQPAPTLWELVQKGLAHGGYITHDEQGNFVDKGWYVHAQLKLAADYGVLMQTYGYASAWGIAHTIQQGKIAAATVSPELGERKPLSRRYGGHLIVVTGFRWQRGRPTYFRVHNPSGRYPELQANAWLPYAKFRREYAYRFATYEPHPTP